MRWITSKPKRKWKGKWYKGKHGLCQECGHREPYHPDGFAAKMCMANGKCRCLRYIPVPEHDFDADTAYDGNAYGEVKKERQAVSQRLISGDSVHNDMCLYLIKVKHPHATCECDCHV